MLPSSHYVCACVCACMFSHLSRIQLFVTPWTVARQAPLFMGFSRQEYWSELLALYQGIFPTQGLNPCLLLWQMGSLPLVPPGSPHIFIDGFKKSETSLDLHAKCNLYVYSFEEHFVNFYHISKCVCYKK